MSTKLISQAQILLGCGCGEWESCWTSCFCPSCASPKCSSRCLSSSLASTYCPRCLENVPSTEAAAYGGRCKKCFECLRCPGVSLQLFPRKALGDFFLACPLCHWTSLALPSDDPRSSAPSPAELLAAFMQAERDAQAAQRPQGQFEQLCRRAASDHHAFLHRKKIEGHAIFQSKLLKEQKTHAVEDRPHSSSQQINLSSPSHHIDPLAPVNAMLDLRGQKLSFPSLSTQPRASLLDAPHPTPGADPFSLSSQSSVPIASSPPAFSLAESTAALRPDLAFADLPPQRVRLASRQHRRCGTCASSLIAPDLGPSKATFNQLFLASTALPRLSLDERLSIHQQPGGEDASQHDSVVVYQMTLVFRNPVRETPFKVVILKSSDDDDARLAPRCSGRLVEIPPEFVVEALPSLTETKPTTTSPIHKLPLRVSAPSHLSELSFAFQVVFSPVSTSSSDKQFTIPFFISCRIH